MTIYLMDIFKWPYIKWKSLNDHINILIFKWPFIWWTFLKCNRTDASHSRKCWTAMRYLYHIFSSIEPHIKCWTAMCYLYHIFSSIESQIKCRTAMCYLYHIFLSIEPQIKCRTAMFYLGPVIIKDMQTPHPPSP